MGFTFGSMIDYLKVEHFSLFPLMRPEVVVLGAFWCQLSKYQKCQYINMSQEKKKPSQQTLRPSEERMGLGRWLI